MFKKGKPLPLLGIWCYYLLSTTFFIFGIWSVFVRYANNRKFQHLKRGAIYDLFELELFQLLQLREDHFSQNMLESLPFVNNFLFTMSISLSVAAIQAFLPNFKLQLYPKGGSNLERSASKIHYFDTIIKKSNVSQIVFLKSQLDCRPTLLSKSDSGRRQLIYEIEDKQLLKYKRKILNHHMTNIISIKLDKITEWRYALKKQGFNEKKSTLFVLDGVIHGNRNEDVGYILENISEILDMNSRSRLLFDYYDNSVLSLFYLFSIPFNRNLIYFGIPGNKSGKLNAERYVKKYSMNIEHHFRMNRVKYGIMITYQRKKQKKRKGRRLSDLSELSLS